MMQILYRILAALAIMINLWTPAGSQTKVTHHVLSPIDTPSEEDIRCALRDSYGFLWLGTANGVRCYDGNGKPVYAPGSRALQPIEKQTVTMLHQIGDDIWMSTDNALYVFSRNDNSVSRFLVKTRYGVPVSAQADRIMEANDGRIWIATSGQGFFIYDPKVGILTQHSRHGAFYTDIMPGTDRTVYLATLNGYIQTFRTDGTLLRQTELPDHIADKHGIHMASSGHNLWIASGTDLYRMNINTDAIEHLHTPNTLGNVTSLTSRHDGTLIIGTANGLWSYGTTDGSISRIKPSPNRHTEYDQRVTAIAEDMGEDLIIVHPEGTPDLLRTQSETFDFIPVPSGNPEIRHSSILALAPTADRRGLWIGSDTGLALYDLATGTMRRIVLGTSCAVTVILPDNTRLWIGTRDSGLLIYDTATGGTERHVYDEHTPYTIPNNTVNAVYRTGQGDIHILTESGLCGYDAEAGNFPPMTDFGQQASGTAMQEDSKGGAWIATSNNGLYHRKPEGKQFDYAFECEDINKGTVTKLHLDGKGRMWAATRNNGVFTYNESTEDWERMDIPALDGRTPSFMTEDADGNLWIGSDEVLVKIDSSGQSSLFSLTRETPHTPTGGAVARLPGGLFAAGTRDGLVVFNPDSLQAYDRQIRVYPSTIFLPALEDTPEEQIRLGLNRLLYTTDTIDIPYSCNTFSINLAAARPMMTPDVAYDYMLEGVDKTWNQATAQSDITYSNVPPGCHRFLLRANGVKDAPVTELTIMIGRPWYLTWWAIAAYALLTAVIGIVAYIAFRRMMKKKIGKQMQALEQQKEGEVLEAKTRYFVRLVHEIRTPLMLLSLPLERLSGLYAPDQDASDKAKGKDQEAMRHINAMQQNLDHLLGITNELLDFEKAESDIVDGAGDSSGESPKAGERIDSEPTPEQEGVTVLLVEDNPDLRSMMAEGLEDHFRVITATDGVDALELLEGKDVDIVVSDVMMPRMDGIELCRRCKEDIRYSHIPFVMLTAMTDLRHHEEGLESGADVYLEKPFPIKQLSYIIGNQLRTRQRFHEHMQQEAGKQDPEQPDKEDLNAPKGHGVTAPSAEGKVLNRMDSEFLKKLDATIEASVNDEDFSIDSLAEKLNMSRSSFYRKLTGVTGMTPSDYLKTFRLNRAATLLKEGCRVTEVAERVGFTSSSYFAKCFREKFGMLPSEYK